MAAGRISGTAPAELLRGLVEPVGNTVPALAGLALDSRRVVAGGAFVALPGTGGHGLDYLDDALTRGATAVFCPAGDERLDAEARARIMDAGARLHEIPDLSSRLGMIAARFFGEPANALDSVIAVTGTDGKTSVSHYIAQLLDTPEAPAAVLGTLGWGTPGATHGGSLTTPDPVTLHETIAALVDHGYRHLAMEASSHGLAQQRLDATRIDVAVLTQLGRDHLDYHGDIDAYAAAKARLFEWPGLRAAVVNLDDEFGRELRQKCSRLPLCIGYCRQSNGSVDCLHARRVQPAAAGLEFDLVWQGDARRVHVPLLGNFNVDNILAAVGALLAGGHDLDDVAGRIDRVRPVPGRMELFREPGAPGIVVDYAHTPGALSAALDGLREHAAGRLWCVFGAGGDRDRGKRPLMGRLAEERADRVIVTDDNPRTEDAAAIVDDILAGIHDRDRVQVEHDRGAALALAFDEAGPGDLILLAGKGHETEQVRGTEVLPWSDREAAAALLRGGGGP